MSDPHEHQGLKVMLAKAASTLFAPARPTDAKVFEERTLTATKFLNELDETLARSKAAQTERECRR